MKKKNNILAVYFYTVLSFLIAILYRFGIQNFEFPDLFYINIQESDYRSFINTVWQVQASISLLFITLTSLIIGNLDKSIYGQKVSEIILIRKNCEITYWDKVIISILLSIINFYFVSHGDLEGTTFIFMISIYITVLLIYDTFKLLFKLDDYESKVKIYIQENMDLFKNDDTCCNEIIERLEYDTIDSIINRRHQSMNKLVNYILLLEEKYNDSNVKDKVFKTFITVFQTLIEYDEFELAKSYINTIKKITNNYDLVEELVYSLKDSEILNVNTKNKNIRNKIDIIILLHNLNEETYEIDCLDKIADEFLNRLINNKDIENIGYFLQKFINIEYKYKTLRIDDMLYEIAYLYSNLTKVEEFYKLNINTIILNIFLDDRDNYILDDKKLLTNFFNRSFFLLNSNERFNYEDKIKLQSYFLDSIIDIFWIKNTQSDKYWILRESLFYIFRTVLNENYINKKVIVNLISTKLYIKSYRLLEYNDNDKSERVHYIIAILSIYLYYISFRDDECYTSEFMEECKAIFNFNYSIDGSTDTYSLCQIAKIAGISILKEFDNIKEELEKVNWEKIPQNGAKVCILSDVINEYYVYYCLLFYEYYNYKCINMEKLSQSQIRKFISYFDNDGFLKDDYLDDYKSFAVWYGFKEGEIPETNNDFYNRLIYEFKKKVFSELESKVSNSDQMKQKINIVERTVRDDIEKNIFFNNKINYEKFIKVSKDIHVPIWEFDYLDSFKFNSDRINYKYYNYIFTEINTRLIRYEYTYNSSNLEDILNKLVNDNIKVDTIINLINSKKCLLHNENPEVVNEYCNFEKMLNNIGNADIGKINTYGSTYYLDSNKFNICLKNVNVDICLPDEKWIETELEKCKKSNEFYSIAINDVLIELDRDDAIWYMKNNYREISTNCEIYIDVQDNCGYKIEFKYE